MDCLSEVIAAVSSAEAGHGQGERFAGQAVFET